MQQKQVYLGMIADIMHPGLINIITEGAKYGELTIGLFTDKAIQHTNACRTSIMSNERSSLVTLKAWMPYYS